MPAAPSLPVAIIVPPEIVKVPGIDAIMFGTGDLSLRMGKSMYDPEVAETVKAAVNTVKESGLICVNVGLPSNIAELYLDGFRVIMSGVCDQEALRYYMIQHLESMRGIVNNHK